MITRLREPRRLYQKPVLPFQLRLFSVSVMREASGRFVPENSLCEALGPVNAYRGSGQVVCPDCGYIVYDHTALEYVDEYGQVIGSERVICSGDVIHT